MALQWHQTVRKSPGSSLSPGQSRKCPIYEGLFLMKQLKIIKSWPLYTHLLFCVMKWEVHLIGFSSLLLHHPAVILLWLKYMKKLWLCITGKGKRISNSFFTFVTHGRLMIVSRESTCVIVPVVSSVWPACFTDHQVYLKVPLTGELWLFRFVCLAGIFLNMNTLGLSLQEKQLEEFAANNKIWTFKWKDVSNKISGDFLYVKLNVSTCGRSA